MESFSFNNKISIIGLGVLGSAIAENFIEKKYLFQVLIYQIKQLKS